MDDRRRNSETGERVGNRVGKEPRFVVHPADQSAGGGSVVAETDAVSVVLVATVSSDRYPQLWAIASDRARIKTELLEGSWSRTFDDDVDTLE